MAPIAICDALAARFPQHGMVVWFHMIYDRVHYGNPSLSVELKFGKSGNWTGAPITIPYAERLSDLLESVQAQLDTTPSGAS